MGVMVALAAAAFEQGTVNLTLKTAAELLEISGFVVDVWPSYYSISLSIINISPTMGNEWISFWCSNPSI